MGSKATVAAAGSSMTWMSSTRRWYVDNFYCQGWFKAFSYEFAESMSCRRIVVLRRGLHLCPRRRRIEVSVPSRQSNRAALVDSLVRPPSARLRRHSADRRRWHSASRWTAPCCMRFGTLRMECGNSLSSTFKAARSERQRTCTCRQERLLQDSASTRTVRASPPRSGSPGTTSGSSKASSNRPGRLTGSDFQATRRSSSTSLSQTVIRFQLAKVRLTTFIQEILCAFCVLYSRPVLKDPFGFELEAGSPASYKNCAGMVRAIVEGFIRARLDSG